MTKARWGELSAFGWTQYARRNWRYLTAPQRRAVFDAALAEEAANEAYGRAADALGVS